MRRMQVSETPVASSSDPPTVESSVKKRPSMKRALKKDDKQLKNDFDRVISDNYDTWLQKTFLNPQVFPPVSSDISVHQISTIVRESFLATTSQPSYRITKMDKGNLWTIAPTSQKILSPQLFVPSARSKLVQERLHTLATFAGMRLMLTAMVAACCRVYALRGNLVHTDADGKVHTVSPEIAISMATKGIWVNGVSPEIMFQGKRIPLDSSPGSHLTAWLRCRGGTFLEVDVCDLANTAVTTVHHTSVPREKMDAMLYLEKTRSTAVQQNIVDNIDCLFPEITKGLRQFNKKTKQKRRKKMKRAKRHL